MLALFGSAQIGAIALTPHAARLVSCLCSPAPLWAGAPSSSLPLHYPPSRLRPWHSVLGKTIQLCSESVQRCRQQALTGIPLLLPQCLPSRHLHPSPCHQPCSLRRSSFSQPGLCSEFAAALSQQSSSAAALSSAAAALLVGNRGSDDANSDLIVPTH